MRLILFMLLSLLLAAPAQAADCDMFKGIWAADRNDGTRLVVYFDDGRSSSRNNTFFELWKENELLARMYGVFTSSMGASINTISVVRDYVPFDEDPDGAKFTEAARVFSSVVEFLYLDDDQMPDWLILAAFAQTQWNLGSDHVDFYGKVENQDHAMAGPNAFRFIGCREGPVSLVAANDPSCKWTSGDVYRGDDASFGIQTCTVDKSKAYLALSCAFDGGIHIQYELAKGFPGPVSADGRVSVTFATENGRRSLGMDGNDMDGTHEVEVAETDELLDLLAASAELTISDEKGDYPIRKVSLDGSRRAINTLLERCSNQPT